ncbi:hypothetical protein ElyMa_004312800 [Elysia marginata]|uniref:Secreted protein n=1 Tax=Elysia marginata TaxID=1093978 RepID=A0AAV4H1X7_9GAST|nr:hypothetical protein ElyMa_004312800 [Elysia marginata]
MMMMMMMMMMMLMMMVHRSKIPLAVDPVLVAAADVVAGPADDDDDVEGTCMAEPHWLTHRLALLDGIPDLVGSL